MLVEIRFGEGGDDSKAFVDELGTMYVRYARAKGLGVEVLFSARGSMTLEVSGGGAWSAFENEAGKHVVQRCPPNERGGRRHTSMVSVAVLPVLNIKAVAVRDGDIDIITQGASGPGGQGVNTTNSAVRMRHKPTGISVHVQTQRSQIQNRAIAYRLLCGRVQEHFYAQQNAEYAAKRKAMLGDSGRGGSRRTYNFFKGFVSDHVLGKQTNDIKGVMKGRLELVH